MTAVKEESYQVLARKYRPQNFKELVGQEVLVQTLTNAIDHDKIAHAFVLTGIRGVGKTTSARIIAKSLNCLGEDGKATKARMPCNKCSNCEAISKSSFQDVLEIDAASRTGVDDIRSIIDSIIYAPAIGRYKVYIIDEVHMLSNNAFNALLKTLEEPPSHTKFIFATTEIKKIPVTVLSRCQRFDLRRLNNQELETYLADILGKENFEFEPQALSLIASSAEGSVRDALSILDRALSCNNYEKNLPAKIVEDLVGSGDKSLTIELFNSLLKGNLKESLDIFNNFYNNSSDISSLVQDLLDVCHRTTMAKTLKDLSVSDLSLDQVNKIKEISEKTSITDLAKFWQMLLKGLNEISTSRINQKNIFEMLLVRMCHISEIPNLKQISSKIEVVKTLSVANKNEEKPQDIATQEGKDFSGEILRNFNGAEIVS